MYPSTSQMGQPAHYQPHAGDALHLSSLAMIVIFSLDELNPQVVKFLHRVNRGFTRSDLLKGYGRDTPAATPKDESEVQEIHPPTKSDEKQDTGTRDAEVDKVDIHMEEVSE